MKSASTRHSLRAANKLAAQKDDDALTAETIAKALGGRKGAATRNGFERPADGPGAPPRNGFAITDNIENETENLIADVIDGAADIRDPLGGLVEQVRADPGGAFTPAVLERP